MLGSTEYPQKVDLPLQDPQSEVDVWLHGSGAPLNVTHTHLMVCGAPFTICIGFEEEHVSGARFDKRLELRFHEYGTRRLLGEIGLRFVSSMRVGPRRLCLFHVADYKNRSLSPLRLWALNLQQARATRAAQGNDVPTTARELRAWAVFYLCPRPVALVSVVHEESSNLFPMDLMGSVGGGYFAFALNSGKAAASLVERARSIVLSNIPFEQSSAATKLGPNHRKSSIDWAELPFSTVRLPAIHAPIPSFASRVREMQVEAVHRLGSHTLFVARTIADEHLAEGPQLFCVHGTSHLWRKRQTQHPAVTRQ